MRASFALRLVSLLCGFAVAQVGCAHTHITCTVAVTTGSGQPLAQAPIEVATESCAAFGFTDAGGHYTAELNPEPTDKELKARMWDGVGHSLSIESVAMAAQKYKAYREQYSFRLEFFCRSSPVARRTTSR